LCPDSALAAAALAAAALAAAALAAAALAAAALAAAALAAAARRAVLDFTATESRGRWVYKSVLPANIQQSRRLHISSTFVHRATVS
jgi:hypothetical protein